MATQPQQTPNPNMGANINAAKQAVFDQAKELGRIHGKGKTARLKLAELAVARSRDNEITVDDAERMWTEMMQGSAEATKEIGGDDPKDTKQRASDLKHFIVLGSNKELDGNELFANAQLRMANLRSSGAVKNARVWELMLGWARKQNDEPQRALEDAEIDKIMADKAKAVKDFVELVDASRRALEDTNEDEQDTEVFNAIDILKKVVADRGGTRKQRMDKARAEAKKLLEAAQGGGATPKKKGKGKGGKHAGAANA